MSTGLRWLVVYPLAALLGGVVVAASLGLIVLVMAWPRLPGISALTDYQPKIPLRIYTGDGHLIGEFGEERRLLVSIDAVPKVLKQAVLAAEDDRFYEHVGVDFRGVARAALANVMGGGKRQGASTITMQVARNFYLSSEKTLTRKLYEALLSLKIEHELSKEEILEVYLNQIYLGQRAYGFGTAARSYFGKDISALTAAEAAMLAGLPKAPSAYNPVANPKRARERQLYVLRRMHELGYLTDEQWREAQQQTLVIKREVNRYTVEAPYVAEMARQLIYEQFGAEAYSRGLKAYTTITKVDQDAANTALRNGVLAYDRRHGYRGAEAYVDTRQLATEEGLEEALQNFSDYQTLLAAVVVEASAKKVVVAMRSGERVAIDAEGLRFARRMLDPRAPASRRLQSGAVIRITPAGQDKAGKTVWTLAQLPDAEAAFVAMDPRTGQVRALVGGFAYERSKFNHVTLAWRQPGSSIKPFVYSAALEKGYTPASLIDDAPLIIPAEETGNLDWMPRNYDGTFDGPMTLREALKRSKNMVSIRILQSIGPKYAQDYLTRFGFDAERHPPYLTMALGAGGVTPWQMAEAYGVFANGGHRIKPYILAEVRDDQGRIVAAAVPDKPDTANRVIDPRNAYLMNSLLQDVTRSGTAARAGRSLKRGDLSGKTGTTNDHIDAWFCGFHPHLVGISWVGFDQPSPLGKGETGGFTALPIWIDYMQTALAKAPEVDAPPPAGVVRARFSEDPPLSDWFYKENLPPPPPPAKPDLLDWLGIGSPSGAAQPRAIDP